MVSVGEVWSASLSLSEATIKKINIFELLEYKPDSSRTDVYVRAFKHNHGVQ